MSTDPDDLLPSNATQLEREMSRLSAGLEVIDVSVIERIWDAWSCPAALLPWLAYAVSVDFWDESWSEITKRQSIADSPDYHRRKGTVAAVETILNLAEKPYEITEWFNQEPQGRRGTALIHIEADLAEVPDILRRIRPLVMTSKPKSRAVFFGAGELALAPLTIGGGLLDESLTTISPYLYAGEDADGAMALGIGLLDETLTTIGAAA